MVIPPPADLALDEFPTVEAALTAELEARHGVRFVVRLGYLVVVDMANV